MANLVQIIQEQNQHLENLQRQLDFTKNYYQEQIRRILAAEQHERSTDDSTRRNR